VGRRTTNADGFDEGQKDGYTGVEFDPFVAGYMSGYRIGLSMAQRLVRIGEQARLDAMVEEDRAARRAQVYLSNPSSWSVGDVFCNKCSTYSCGSEEHNT